MAMKSDRRAFLKGSVAAVAAGATAGAAMWPINALAATTLDLSEVLPEDNWQTVQLKAFSQALAERTSGEVNIRVHSGGALGFKGPEHLRAVADGLVPMADLLGAQQTGDLPLFKAENLHFLISGPDELKIFHKYWKPEIFRIVEERFNQKFLTTVPSPVSGLYMNVAAKTIDDLRNLRMRGASATDAESYDLIGMAGIQIPWGELIPALATGRVDGVGTSYTSGVDGKFWEFLKYIYPTNHVWSSNFTTINLDTWNSLSKQNQDAMLELAAEFEPQFWANSKALGDAALETMVAKGMQVYDMPDGLLAEMQARTRPNIDRYIAEVPEAGPMIKAYLEEVGRA